MFALLAGLGILTVALFPLALPGVLLFVVAPLILVLAVGLLLAIPLVPAVWLVGTLRRRRSRRLAWAAPSAIPPSESLLSEAGTTGVQRGLRAIS